MPTNRQNMEKGLRSQEPIIRFSQVAKSFGAQTVCHDITLDIWKNEIVSVLGPSGCGKTLTLKMLVGLIAPDKGSIWFGGRDVAKVETQEGFSFVRQKISMVFQGAALFDSINVFDNIAYPLRFLQSISEKVIREKVFNVLELVGLTGVHEKMPLELSGGMKKRIGIARAIVTEPEVILYDEPNAGLDPINTTRVVDLILMMREKYSCTSIVVTHDMNVAEKISDKVTFFYGGRVRKTGTMSELRDSSDSLVRSFIMGDPDAFLTKLEGA